LRIVALGSEYVTSISGWLTSVGLLRDQARVKHPRGRLESPPLTREFSLPATLRSERLRDAGGTAQ